MPQPTDPLIAFTDPADPTGPVRLVYPAPNSPLDLAELAARTVPEGANTAVLSRGDLPGDRLFPKGGLALKRPYHRHLFASGSHPLEKRMAYSSGHAVSCP
ncbi:MAG: hypothetical protein R2857_14345 [Vampirovibrionales bacterium]